MKQYITPEIEIVGIKLTQDILAASQEESVPVYTETVSPEDPQPFDFKIE